MRVLVVHNEYQQAGGEDAVVEEEIEALRTNGHDVSLFAASNHAIDGFTAKLKTSLLATYNPFAKRAMRARIETFRPDVVHVHNFFPLLSPSIFDACSDTGVPSVLTLHNFRIVCPTATLFHDGRVREDSLHASSGWAVCERVYKQSFLGTLAVSAMVETHKRLGTWQKKVDRFIALTHFAKRKFIEAGLPAQKIVVKGNARSAPAYIEPTRRHGALFVGRLSVEKGIQLLVDAWKDLTYPLRIAGDGPLREFVTRATSGNANIEYLGRVDAVRVRHEMTRAAFLVLPSTG